MSWWNRPDESEPAAPAARPGVSVYENWPAPDPDEGLDWTPVCELDPLTGQIRRVNPDWSREVGGWVPLDQILGRRF